MDPWKAAVALNHPQLRRGWVQAVVRDETAPRHDISGWWVLARARSPPSSGNLDEVFRQAYRRWPYPLLGEEMVEQLDFEPRLEPVLAPRGRKRLIVVNQNACELRIRDSNQPDQAFRPSAAGPVRS